MATDPRLEAAGLSAGSGTPYGPVARLEQRLANAEKRIAVLERMPRVQTGSGPPTQATRDGVFYVDVTNSRIYARSAGAWKSVVIA